MPSNAEKRIQDVELEPYEGPVVIPEPHKKPVFPAYQYVARVFTSGKPRA